MKKFVPIFVTTIFLSLHYGAILYVNSSLLGTFFRPDAVSLLYIVGALGNILLFLFAPQLIERFGKRPLLVSFLILAGLGTLVLAFAQTALSVLLAFSVYSSMLYVIYYYLDIFLEEISLDTRTGEIRGLYFTFVSLGIACGPLILSAFAEGEGVSLVYITAALLLIPPLLLSFFSLKSESPKWHGRHPEHMNLPFRTWWQTPNIRRATLAKMALEFFYALMVIYTPLYLHGVLGFSWSELGIIFTVMLLPFILLEWPTGEVADRFWGEKELMGTGFLIMTLSLLVMPFLGKIFFAWMAILFLSRVGASMVEITTESYFFKNVNAEDTRLISIFRLARPVSIVFASAVGVIVLNLFSFEKIFLVLAAIVLLGLREIVTLKDTR